MNNLGGGTSVPQSMGGTKVPLPKGYKQTEIGVIPEEWEVVELKAIGQIVTGSTPKTSNQEYYTNGTRLWASPSDLGKSKEVKNTANKLTDLGFQQTRILPARSILVTCIGSTIGKIGMAYEEMSTNQQINALVCIKENSPDFYYYVLDMKKEYIVAPEKPNFASVSRVN